MYPGIFGCLSEVFMLMKVSLSYYFLDPSEWTEVQIHHWLQWAIQEFKIAHVAETFWNITGKQLCQMSLDEYKKKVPVDPHNHFWTHIELLRKCHIFGKHHLNQYIFCNRCCMSI
jgi:hypothetical protein